MATHSSILAWRIPWTEEPGGLQSMGLQRIGHDLVTEQQQESYPQSVKTEGFRAHAVLVAVIPGILFSTM